MNSMKKFTMPVIVTAFFVMMTASTFAQEQVTATESVLTPKYGIKLGLNFANLYVDNVQNEYMKLGGFIGFFAKLPISKGLSFQPEILYTNKGSKLTYGNFVQGSGEYRFNLNYIEVPFLFVINLTSNFSVSAGGYVAYLASANVTDMRADGTVNGVTNLNENDFNRSDYGLVGGASIDIQRFTIGARYNYGLQNIGKTGSIAGDLTQNSKNSVASIFIGFAF